MKYSVSSDLDVVSLWASMWKFTKVWRAQLQDLAMSHGRCMNRAKNAPTSEDASSVCEIDSCWERNVGPVLPEAP